MRGAPRSPHAPHSTYRPIKVAGIGRACMDRIVRASDADMRRCGVTPGRHRQLCSGEMDAVLKALDAEKLGRDSRIIPGGPLGNTLTRLAQAPATTVAFLGRRGRDAEGRIWEADLHENGIRYQGTPSLSGRTERCVVFVRPEDGARTFLYDPGITDQLLKHDVESYGPFLAEADYLILGLPARQSACSAALAAALAHAKAAQVVLTLHGYQPEESLTAGLWSLAQLVVGNDDELALLAETLGLDSIEALPTAGPGKTIACTRGAAGLDLLTGEQQTHVPAEPVTPIVDTTGAGDNWLAGFLWALGQSWSPGAAAAEGNRWAAEILQVWGGRLPQRPSC